MPATGKAQSIAGVLAIFLQGVPTATSMAMNVEDGVHRDVFQHNTSRTIAYMQSAFQYYLALDITAQSNEFLYDGAAWEQTAPYTDPSGNRVLAPFFSTDAVGVRVEMNGQSHDFFLENSDLGKSLHTLVTGTPVLQTPCSGANSNKPYAYAMVQTSTAHSDLWGVVATNSLEPFYCTNVDRLSFNAHRMSVKFRIGILRDEEACCCCPGSADGIGIHSVSSGVHEHGSNSVFYASKVYVITQITPSLADVHVDLSGGNGGASGQSVYTAPDGTVVSSSAPTYTNSNYYYLGYLFDGSDSHEPSGCSSNDVHTCYWVTDNGQTAAIQTLSITLSEVKFISRIRVHMPALIERRSNYRIEVASTELGTLNDRSGGYVDVSGWTEDLLDTYIMEEVKVVQISLQPHYFYSKYSAFLDEVELFEIPPTPSPTSALIWAIGSCGQSCDSVCSGMGGTCDSAANAQIRSCQSFLGTLASAGITWHTTLSCNGDGGGSYEGMPALSDTGGVTWWTGGSNTFCNSVRFDVHRPMCSCTGASVAPPTSYSPCYPTPYPTAYPSPFPTLYPTAYPSPFPTAYPSPFPTLYPTAYPSPFPTAYPSPFPTLYPTAYPSPFPTAYPSPFPTLYPTAYPSPFPTSFPTPSPTHLPTPNPTSNPTSSPTSSPTPSPTQVVAPPPTGMTVAGVGDPHLVNTYGQKFDLFQAGHHTLIKIPRWARQRTNFLVQAIASRAGAGCADLYFTEVNISGSWTRRHRAADLRWAAEVARPGKAKWMKFHGGISVKIVHGHTVQSTRYLNILVKGLGRVEGPVGGLLGGDDHTAAATPDKGCKKLVSL
ncbi:unnamed protein product [Prorocentrum cordatum]|uniref:Subtilisin n=1 Tax=Prorocentrum cordatum TaxID=2364126 RepID=A0ABN9S5E3_9DINO|nr:unnamed protein product [Polarella glacialis]